MPPNTVRVARPSTWGNPYRIGKTVPHDWPVGAGTVVASRDIAVQLFREFVDASPDYQRAVRTALAGRDLACWCPLEDADGDRMTCHADILLSIANPDPDRVLPG